MIARFLWDQSEPVWSVVQGELLSSTCKAPVLIPNKGKKGWVRGGYQATKVPHGP